MTDTVAAWDGLFWTGAEPPYIPGILATVDASLTRVTLNMTLASASGTLWWAVTPSTYVGEPTIAQIKAGATTAGVTGAGSAPVTAAGQFTLLTTQILTPANSYKAFAYHEDAQGRAGSAAVSSEQYVQVSEVFNTDPPVTEVNPAAVSVELQFEPPQPVGAYVDDNSKIKDVKGTWQCNTSGTQGRIEVQTAIKFAGTQAMKSMLGPDTPIAYRSEIDVEGYPWEKAVYAPGLESWRGWAMYVDPNYHQASPGGSLWQVHTGTQLDANGVSIAVGGNPHLTMRFDQPDGRLYCERRSANPVELAGQASRKYFPAGFTLADLKGKWITVIVNYKYAKDATGHIRVYVKPLVDAAVVDPGVVWENCITWDPRYTRFGKYTNGLYSGESSKGTLPPGAYRHVYYDSIRVASVQAGGNFQTVNPGSYV